MCIYLKMEKNDREKPYLSQFCNMLPHRYMQIVWAFLCSILLFSGCGTRQSTSTRLQEIDNLIMENPSAGLDSLLSLQAMRPSMDGYEKAYFELLQTIAQHKNRIVFSSDSLIDDSRRWFESNGKNPHLTARSLFYNGLVLYLLASDDTTACRMMKKSLQILDQARIEDDRLAALACSYLGRINDYHTFNFEEATQYYERAVQLEMENGNAGNLIYDYCDLLTCLIKKGDLQASREVWASLDSTLVAHPEIQFEKIKNTKAIYYLNVEGNMDSAEFYCLKWSPGKGEFGTKQALLAQIYRKTGQLDSAVFYEKKALKNRRQTDSLQTHIYYRNLANLYGQLGETDSSFHYAMLAYESLRESLDRKTEKRILELEKQYDMIARQASLDRIRNNRNLLMVLLASFAILAASLAGFLHIKKKQLATEKVSRSLIQAAAKTHQNTLSLLNSLKDKPRSRTVESLQNNIKDITKNLRTGFSNNLSEAIESNLNSLPRNLREGVSSLTGARSKTVFLLSQFGYTDEEIAAYTCMSVDSVRVTKNNNEKTLSQKTI